MLVQAHRPHPIAHAQARINRIALAVLGEGKRGNSIIRKVRPLAAVSRNRSRQRILRASHLSITARPYPIVHQHEGRREERVMGLVRIQRLCRDLALHNWRPSVVGYRSMVWARQTVDFLLASGELAGAKTLGKIDELLAASTRHLEDGVRQGLICITTGHVVSRPVASKD